MISKAIFKRQQQEKNRSAARKVVHYMRLGRLPVPLGDAQQLRRISQDYAYQLQRLRIRKSVKLRDYHIWIDGMKYDPKTVSGMTERLRNQHDSR